jgi:hypothetical protein
MSKSVLFTISTVVALGLSACAFDTTPVDSNDGSSGPGSDAAEDPDLGSGTPSAADLAGRRARVLWEAARVMVGPALASAYAWPAPSAGTSYTLATYPYAAEDAGAWWAMFAAAIYTAKGIVGYNISCTVGGYSCQLAVPLKDGLSKYTCQGDCAAATIMRGGQCKAFNNLVLYRSGVYHGDNWAFKPLPSDASLGDNAKYPFAVKGRLAAGDVLRMPYGHSALVTRVVAADTVVVLDANWIAGGDGNEAVGTHLMKFGGAGYYGDLAKYRLLNCVYDGTC